jgi:TPR repeat protein
MTTAWKYPSDRQDSIDGHSSGPDVAASDSAVPQSDASQTDMNGATRSRAEPSPAEPSQGDDGQLEMFVAPPAKADGARLPPAADPLYGGGAHDIEPQGADLMITDLPMPELPPSARHGAGAAADDELRRLEDSVRWLMNESVRHLPRATTLPLVPGLRPIERGSQLVAVNRYAASRTLDPNLLFPPQPPRRDSAVWGAAKFLIASAVAAPAAYFIANAAQRFDAVTLPDPASVAASVEVRLAAVMPIPQRSSSEPMRSPDRVEATPAAEPTAVQAIPPAEAKPEETTDLKVVEPALPPEPSLRNVAAMPPGNTAVAAVSPELVAASNPRPSPPPSVPKPVLSAQEIRALVQRGHMLFESGDVAAARLFFRRAAAAGDAAAALAMGSTFDPDVLSKHLVRGMGANLDEARLWYEKARELGSPEGPSRLETLLAHR